MCKLLLDVLSFNLKDNEAKMISLGTKELDELEVKEF